MGGTRKCLICRGTPAFTWPRDINARQEWTKFVSKYCPEKKIYQSSSLCYRHFSKNSFKNYDDYVRNVKKNEITREVLL